MQTAIGVTLVLGLIAAALLVLGGISSEQGAMVGLGLVTAVTTWLAALGLRWGRDVLSLLHSTELRAVRADESVSG